LATPPLTPQAWCRRILTSLSQREVQRREAGNLEMLLSYFIQLDPTAEAFDELLAQYVSDPRPGIAEAAALLQSSWLRGRTAARAPEPAPPALQETLRTLGALIDEAGARIVYLAVEPHRAQVQRFGGEPTQQAISRAELMQEIAARQALRGQVPAVDPTSAELFETRLRAVGAELDREPSQAYELVITPRSVVVEGSAGYHRVFTLDELGALMQAGAGRRQGDDQPNP
jgi:hypothetical protein